jgi:glycosyltransferase involved in cell wall biosynthesis
MKILHCAHSLDPATGGPVEFLKQITRAMVCRGHDLEVVSLDTPDVPGREDLPAKVHRLGSGRGSYGYSPSYLPWLRGHGAEFNAVMIHGLWQYQSFGAWRALRDSGTPYYVFPHGMLDPWFNRAHPLKHLKKLIYWRWAEYRVLRDAAAVFFGCEEERRLARESFSPYRCREIVVNFGTATPQVDLTLAREEFLSAFPQLRAKSFLLFLGRLHPKKGLEELIRAFARVASPHLVIAGPCTNQDYLQNLHRLTAALNLASRITFTGMLSGSRKWGALAAAEAFILPSHQENFGIAVVEALACARPVLLSRQVNIWHEIVADGCGLAESDDLAGTQLLLERWVETSPAKRMAMREKARRSFADRFEINRSVDSLLGALHAKP